MVAHHLPDSETRSSSGGPRRWRHRIVLKRQSGFAQSAVRESAAVKTRRWAVPFEVRMVAQRPVDIGRAALVERGTQLRKSSLTGDAVTEYARRTAAMAPTVRADLFRATCDSAAVPNLQKIDSPRLLG